MEFATILFYREPLEQGRDRRAEVTRPAEIDASESQT